MLIFDELDVYLFWDRAFKNRFALYIYIDFSHIRLFLAIFSSVFLYLFIFLSDLCKHFMQISIHLSFHMFMLGVGCLISLRVRVLRLFLKWR